MKFSLFYIISHQIRHYNKRINFHNIYHSYASRIWNVSLTYLFCIFNYVFVPSPLLKHLLHSFAKFRSKKSQCIWQIPLIPSHIKRLPMPDHIANKMHHILDHTVSLRHPIQDHIVWIEHSIPYHITRI